MSDAADALEPDELWVPCSPDQLQYTIEGCRQETGDGGAEYQLRFNLTCDLGDHQDGAEFEAAVAVSAAGEFQARCCRCLLPACHTCLPSCHWASNLRLLAGSSCCADQHHRCGAASGGIPHRREPVPGPQLRGMHPAPRGHRPVQHHNAGGGGGGAAVRCVRGKLHAGETLAACGTACACTSRLPPPSLDRWRAAMTGLPCPPCQAAQDETGACVSENGEPEEEISIPMGAALAEKPSGQGAGVPASLIALPRRLPGMPGCAPVTTNSSCRTPGPPSQTHTAAHSFTSAGRMPVAASSARGCVLLAALVCMMLGLRLPVACVPASQPTPTFRSPPCLAPVLQCTRFGCNFDGDCRACNADERFPTCTNGQVCWKSCDTGEAGPRPCGTRRQPPTFRPPPAPL